MQPRPRTARLRGTVAFPRVRLEGPFANHLLKLEHQWLQVRMLASDQCDSETFGTRLQATKNEALQRRRNGQAHVYQRNSGADRNGLERRIKKRTIHYHL